MLFRYFTPFLLTAGALPALAQETEATTAQVPIIDSSTVLIVTVLIMFLVGIGFVHITLKRQNQGFGPTSIKALGVLLFIPLLVFAFGYARIPGEAITALLGTLAGYLFSPTASDQQKS